MWRLSKKAGWLDWGDLAGVGEQGELTKDIKCTWESLLAPADAVWWHKADEAKETK